MIRADRRITMAIGALVLALAAGWAWQSGFRFGGGDKPAADTVQVGPDGVPRRDEAVSVATAQSRVQDVPVTIDAVGTVQALNTVTIRTQVDGRLLNLAFTEGQDVKKGDVLAEIDPSLYKALYDQAVAKKAQDEANLANARVDLVRYEKLVAGKFRLAAAICDPEGAGLAARGAGARRSGRDRQHQDDAGLCDDPLADRRARRHPARRRRQYSASHPIRPASSSSRNCKPIYVVFTLPQQALPAVQKAQAAGIAKVRALGPDNATALETGELAGDRQSDRPADRHGASSRRPSPIKDLGLWPGQFVNVRLMLDTIRNAHRGPEPGRAARPERRLRLCVGTSDGRAHMKQRHDGTAGRATGRPDVGARTRRDRGDERIRAALRRREGACVPQRGAARRRRDDERGSRAAAGRTQERPWRAQGTRREGRRLSRKVI